MPNIGQYIGLSDISVEGNCEKVLFMRYKLNCKNILNFETTRRNMCNSVFKVVLRK